ncbi:hypothetical protein [Sinorhizobium meliloti]|uniref:hypothetical protein n=1 Tax=Rhizobium meliloti TaxID=382 RepID=UPI000FE0505C|nr:hypothetical protein [Sinorhizobium meliloti]RVG70892.1 hypothetical protein CN222_01780 [Sinorhizobium meliloti]
MRELSYENILKEPDATVFAAVPPGGEEGHLRIKLPDADYWGDEYATWTFKVYDEQDRRELAEMLLDPARAMAQIRAARQGEQA